MIYEKPLVTIIDFGDNDIITSSVGGCGDAASQYAEAWVTNCDNPNHKEPCTNKAHRGENI